MYSCLKRTGIVKSYWNQLFIFLRRFARFFHFSRKIFFPKNISLVFFSPYPISTAFEKVCGENIKLKVFRLKGFEFNG